MNDPKATPCQRKNIAVNDPKASPARGKYRRERT